MKTSKEGDSTNVRVAEEFVLSLPVLGAAGYEWEVVDMTPGLVFLGSVGSGDQEEDGTSPEAIGGEFPQKLRFRADQSGKFEVHLVCKRPWEDATPIKYHTETVIARGH